MTESLPPPPRVRPQFAYSRLRAADLLPVGTLGLRTRRLRTVLSVIGVAVGVAALVSVLGITRSSQADLLARVDRLGTNLLTVVNGRVLGGDEVPLPVTAAASIGRTDGVLATAPTAVMRGIGAYRTDRVPAYRGGSMTVRATDPSLLSTLDGRLAHGTFLNDATVGYPVAVLGYQAATALGLSHVDGQRIWIGGRWYTVAGILEPLELASEIDWSVLVGFPMAARDFGYDGHPSRIYVRAQTPRTAEVAGLLARAADPEHPEQVNVSRPSDVLAARLAVAGAGTALFLGLGAVALCVGGIGIANVMIIAILERRTEIGLRRALGAARRHIGVQFLTEALLLALLGGLVGVALGCAVTAAVAHQEGWAFQVPAVAGWGGLLSALAIGAVAGLYPALRAARLAPTEALRGV
jgi:putative ABC transport system permease protein